MAIKKRRTLAILLATALGAAYGFVSASVNQSPYGTPLGKMLLTPEEQSRVWHWSPSPAWLPSFVMCKAPPNGWGISRTRSGYLFRSEGSRIVYFAGSTLIGGLLAVLSALAVVTIIDNRRAAPKNRTE